MVFSNEVETYEYTQYSDMTINFFWNIITIQKIHFAVSEGT